MPINQNEIVDLLYKKIAFNAAKTDTESSRSPSEEPIASPISTFGNHIWVAASSIPATPPPSDTNIVKRYQSSESDHIRLIKNTDVSNNRSWIAESGSISLPNWIPPIFGAQYGIKVWVGNPETNPGTAYRIYPKGSGSSDEFYFDYNAGTLHFIGDSLPTGIGSGSEIYVEGYTYVGPTDVGALNATTLNDLADVTIDDGTRIQGHVLQWNNTNQEWVNGPVPSGSLDDFLLTPPIQHGQVLAYVTTENDAQGNPISVNKFKNQYLPYYMLEGVPNPAGNAGKYLRVASDLTVEYHTLTDLYSSGFLINVAGSQLEHEEALAPTVLSTSNPGAAGAVKITNANNPLQSIPTANQGPEYLTDSDLWVMITTELDKSGHVLGRAWRNLNGIFNQYTELSDYNQRWAEHLAGNDSKHNIWGHLSGVHSSLQTAGSRNKLLVKDEDNNLNILSHQNIVVSNSAISEVHGTHVGGKTLPDFFAAGFQAPSDQDVLAYSASQDAWVFSSIASSGGQANTGSSLSAADADAFNIYSNMDIEVLNFRGIKVFDANNNAVTSFSHTWNNGTVPDADYPFLVRESPDTNTIDFKFDATKIKIYELADRLNPSSIGYTLKQLEDWSSANNLVNPPSFGTGANTIAGKAYAEGWFSNPVDSNTPNEMTQLEWAALMGGGLAALESPGRRLRTEHRAFYATNNPGEPTSIQQQIDDKLQYNFFVQHFTLGGRASEVRDANFGGHYSQNAQYGFPRTVETTEGLTNPIYEGLGWAHEAKSIIFEAAELSHAGEASWGNTFNNNWGNATPPEWTNSTIQKYNQWGGDEAYHTVKSVITRHVLAHEGNPHGVTHLEVGSSVAQWNANKILGANVTLSGISNNDVLVWNGSEWVNSNIMAQSGEQNQAVNIGSGEGLYTQRSGHHLQFKGLSSANSRLILNATADNIEFEVDETQIDITNLNNFPLDISQLSNVSGTPANGDVLGYNGSGWVPVIPPGTTDFEYDGNGVNEDYYLIAEEVMDPNTGLSHTPKKWKWVAKDKYTVANKLSGNAHSVSGAILEGDLSIDYENIVDGNIMAWNGTSWVAIANPAIAGSGEFNRIGSWADADLGNDQTSSGVSLAAETITLGNGTELDVSKRTMPDGTVRLMTKTIVSSPYISVDTTISNAKEIAFTIDESQLSLENMGGDLDPSRISPGTVTIDEFNKLDGYTGVPIGARFTIVETDITNLETLKLDVTDFQLHTNYDNSLRGGDYNVGYNPAVTPGNPNGQTIVADLGGLKHQPYEIGNNLPVFNASKILNAPIDPTFAIADGSTTGISTLTMDHGGKFLQWDGTQWTIGGGGEVSDGTHQQFAFYYSHSPNVSTDTQTLKPTGDAFVFIQGNGAEIESKVGMYTTDPPELFSISGTTPTIALKQITDASNEPEIHGGWGKFYARSSAGGISAESVAVIHFDGAGGANSFLNDGNGLLFFLPKHDSNGNGIYDATNNVVTSTDRYIFGGSSGYFPGGTSNYLAAPVPSGEIELLNKPFSFDFWFMPVLEDGETQLQGKQYLCGQYQQAETYWYIAIDYDGAQHSLEFVWKEWDGGNNATVHTRTLLRSPFGNQNFSADTWHHVVLQRYPSGSVERFDLLVAEATAHGFTGTPSSANGDYGLPHLPYENEKVLMNIPEINGDFLIGNFCRQENQGYNGFRGYIDEFRFQIGTYIDYVGLAFQNYYRTYSLPYDTGNSALMYKDDLGTYDLLNSAGIVRRLKDQDGDTTIDVDTGNLNDNHVRIQTSAIEVANFSQSGFQLSNTDVRVSTIKNDLSNAYPTSLVTQKAVKDALDAISTKSIQDTAGTTYVHTEETTNDYAIRLVVQNSEKLSVEANGVNLKSPLLLSGTGPTEGQSLIGDASGNLTWGNVSVDGVDAGTTGSITMYKADGTELGPATGVSWNPDSVNVENTNLKIRGKQKFHYLNMDQDAFLNDTAELYVQHYGDGNDQHTRVLHHFDSYSASSVTTSVDFQGNAGTATGNTNSGEDTYTKKFGTSSWRSGTFDNSGNFVSASSGQGTHGGMGNLTPSTSGNWTYDFWIRPAISSWPGNGAGTNQLKYSKVFQSSRENRDTFGVYLDQDSGGDTVNIYFTARSRNYSNGDYPDLLTSIRISEWTHVAIMRKGDTLYCFRNGYPVFSQAGSGQFGTNYQGNSTSWPEGWPGHHGSGNSPTAADFIGHIDEFRVCETDRYNEVTGFAPRTTAYGSKETQLIVKDKNNFVTNLMEENPNSVTTEDLLPGNYLIKGQGEDSKKVSQSGIYESEGTLYLPQGDICYFNSNDYTASYTNQKSNVSAKTGVSNYSHSLVYGDKSYVSGSYDRQDSLVPSNTSSWRLHNKNLNIKSKFKTMGVVTAFSAWGYGNYNPPVFGTNDGCIEFWIKSNNSNAGSGEFMRFSGNSTPYLSCYLSFSSGEGSFSFSGNTGGHGDSDEAYPADQSLLKYAVDGDWHHFAWVRNGTFSGFFINGVLKASTTMTENYDIKDGFYSNQWWSDTVGKQKIGWTDALSSETYLCDLEITIGHSKYGTTSFTPPAERNQQDLYHTDSLGEVTNISKVSKEYEAGRIAASEDVSYGANMPTGSLIAWAGSSIPSGWLAADGSNTSRATYSALFSAIGTSYGVGDGSTTFGLPDFSTPAPWIIKT
jgi:hypothetical protein